MNSNKKYDQGPELQLQEVQMESHTSTDLEMIMTNSAFGYEYAVVALEEEEDAFGIDAARIQSQLEQFKELYFDARQKLEVIDAPKLARVESDLQMQKLVVFAKREYLH